MRRLDWRGSGTEPDGSAQPDRQVPGVLAVLEREQREIIERIAALEAAQESLREGAALLRRSGVRSSSDA